MITLVVRKTCQAFAPCAIPGAGFIHELPPGQWLKTEG